MGAPAQVGAGITLISLDVADRPGEPGMTRAMLDQMPVLNTATVALFGEARRLGTALSTTREN
ncbi:hypothetical protein [Cellulomonas fimi]|uniref:Uncharacterized protein n=1 Tax=Cellulomonas fimi TaxID=1708 RepID=A0A7Y0LX99_CELFI|nr:hypothetical protein [Cellulomonas fimi]NMR19504.1 hypothetical protein [Cellulomonas fimi]